jgi:hypothetical protein
MTALLELTVDEANADEADVWDDLWDSDELPDAQPQQDDRPLDVLSSVHHGGHVRPVDAKGRDKLLFVELADELAAAARGLSSTKRAARHPAYGEILAMGDAAIPWLIERLEKPGDRPLWLRLLGSLTPFEPGAGRETISDAALAWVEWGKSRSRS